MVYMNTRKMHVLSNQLLIVKENASKNILWETYHYIFIESRILPPSHDLSNIIGFVEPSIRYRYQLQKSVKLMKRGYPEIRTLRGGGGFMTPSPVRNL